MLTRWGPFRWWRGLHVTTDKPEFDRLVHLRFYGFGFWMCPVIVGWARPTAADGTGGPAR